MGTRTLVFCFCFVFLAPSRFQTVFYASWQLCGGEPRSEAETLADSFSRPLVGGGDQENTGGRAFAPALVTRIPELGEHGVTCRPSSWLKPESLAKTGLASSFL